MVYYITAVSLSSVYAYMWFKERLKTQTVSTEAQYK